MIATKVYSRIVGLLLGATFLISVVPAQAIILDAVEDTWIRENSPLNSYNDDSLSAWGTPESDIRYSVVEFNLSSTIGQTLNTVYLSLFDPSDPNRYFFDFVQEAYVLTTALPPSIAEYTWAEYEAWDAANEAGFASFGNFDIPVGEQIAGYNASAMGSAADIALLESVRDNNGGRVILILKATEGQRDWLDIERDTPPQLVFNQSPPIPGDLNGDGLVDEEDLGVIRDPANWLQTVPVGTRGDLSGDGRVDLRDFHSFKLIFQQHQAPMAVAVPEPTTLMSSLLVLGSSFIVRGRCWNR